MALMDTLETSNLKFFHEPKDRLRLTVGEERSYPTVVPAWASPLSFPEQFLSFLDAKGEEITMVEKLGDLPEHSREAVAEELRRRYLTSTILEITHAKVEFGATYWSVNTERGPRDFVAQSLQENAQWLGPNQLLIVDIDGNRFEIPDVTKLDPTSRHYIDTIL